MKKYAQLFVLALTLDFLVACGGGNSGAGSTSTVTALALNGLGTSTAGFPLTLTVTARDSAGGVATSYSGTVQQRPLPPYFPRTQA
jgi:hypothetical protein